MILSWRCISSGQALPTCVNMLRPSAAGSFQLIEGWVAMPGRNRDAAIHQEFGDVPTLIAFRGQRHQLHQSAAGVQQALRILNVGRFHCVQRMRADIAFLRADEKGSTT